VYELDDPMAALRAHLELTARIRGLLTGTIGPVRVTGAPSLGFWRSRRLAKLYKKLHQDGSALGGNPSPEYRDCYEEAWGILGKIATTSPFKAQLQRPPTDTFFETKGSA
jgi:hypothetical protein